MSVAPLALALAIDLAAGEYPARLHPVVWMGWVITRLERRAPGTGRALPFVFGLGMALFVPALFAVGAMLLLRAAAVHSVLALVVEATLLKATFSIRALGEAAGAVSRSLGAGDLSGARAGLRSLCSRDAAGLDASRVAGAAIESVAENGSDSVVAPLLFWALLGLPGAVAYRAINTLDARIGYHGAYEWLGKASARLDDLVNLVPSRVTAALLLVAGLTGGGNARRGLAVLLRDGAMTESPNAGRPMAAMAGLLGVELEKVGAYRLAEGAAAPGHETIRVAWRWVFRAAVASAGLAAILSWALHAGR